MAGTGANSVPLGPLHPALRGQKSGGGSGESMLNAARLAAARVTANLKQPSNMPEMKQERPVAAAYRPFPDAGDSIPSKRRKRSRWGGEEKAPVPSLIPSGISADQEKQVLLHLKIEDLSRKLRSGDLGIPPNPEDRSPSPEPIYDHNGKRLNTREYRTRKKLEEERHIAVQDALTVNPEYKPPADYKPPVQKVSDRVMIPQDDHPHINFVGLLIGPRGNTLKKLEKDTGTKIMIRGKGSVKEGKVGRKDGQPLPGEDEPLHALVTASNAEAVKKAVDQITQTIKEGIEQPEGQNDLRRKQLRELAKLNGTLREEDMLRCSNCGATDHRTWQCPEKQNVTSNVLCGICGAAGHVTADCRQKANIESPFSGSQPAGQQLGGNLERAKMDSEYMSFMAELGEGPPQSERANNQPQQPPASGPPPVNPPSLLQPPVSQAQNGSGQPPLGSSSQNNQGPNNLGPSNNQDDRPPFTRRNPYDRNSFGNNRGPGGTPDDRGSYNDSYRSGSSQYQDNFQGGSQYGDSPRPFGRPRPLMGSQSPYSWRRDRNDDRGSQFGGPPPRRYPPPFSRRGPGGTGGPPPRGMGPGGPMPPRGPPPPGPGGIPPLMQSMPPNMGPPSGMGQPRPPMPPMGYMGGPPQLGGPVGPPMNVPWGPGNAGGMPPVPPSSQHSPQPAVPSSQTSTSVASVVATTSTAQPVPPPPSMIAQPPPPPPSSDPQPAPPAPPGGQPFQAANNAGPIAASSGGVSMPTQSPWQQMQQQQSVSMATNLGVSIAPPATTSAPLYPWQTAAAALEAMAAGKSQPSLPTSSAAASSGQKTSTATTTTASTPASSTGVSMAPPAQPGVPHMAPMMGMGQMPQWSQMMYPGMGMGMGMGMMPGMGQMGMMMPPQPTMGAPMMPPQPQPMVSQGQQQQQTSTAASMMPFQPPPPPIDSNQMASLVSAPPPPPPPP